MGQTLSCVSKKKCLRCVQKNKGSKDLEGSKVALKPKKKGNKRIKIVGDTVEATENAPLSAAAPNNLGSAPKDGTVRLRENFAIMKLAPPRCPLPTRLPVKSSPSKSGEIWPHLDNTKFVEPLKMNKTDAQTIHSPQPVDQVARDLALGDPKPATWTDLYWALIGQRHLKSDLERVRAIFSWLCSLPLGENAFITKAELEKAVEMNIDHAAEALKAKAKEPASDSPEVIINDFTQGKSTYLRGFESLCRYSGLPCYTIKGLAKGVDYTVGMSLTEPTPSVNKSQTGTLEYSSTSPLARLQHAWSAVYIDGKWALFDSMWAAERLAVNANARLSQLSPATGRIDTDTDMFYFNADPAKFIYSHYPFDPHWQLLNPPMTLKEFQDCVLLKPSFFAYGLGLLSHQDGVISIHSKLIIRLSLPPSLVSQLLFTFNLKIDGKDQLLEGYSDGVNLSRFGIHEISRSEATVTFSFRFPKAGRYKLTIYARLMGDNLFTDVCEYRVEATGTEPATVDEKSIDTRIDVPPFPPTAQSQYGPTEKAGELGLRPVGHDDSQRRCKTGVFEIRFTTAEQGAKLPKVTARLKSLLYDSSMLIDCLVIRTTEGMLPSTLGSLTSKGSSGLALTGPMVPMVAITAYLPTAGEYALEVYAAPPDADDSASYFLTWQFMIDAETGVNLSTPVRKQLATCNPGAQDEKMHQLGIRVLSHPDPLIHVPTAGSLGMVKTRSKGELMQQFMDTMQKRQKSNEMNTDQHQSKEELGVPSDKAVIGDEEQDPHSCDLSIVLEKPAGEHITLIGQLLDISEPQEEDRSTYLLKLVEKSDLSDTGSVQKMDKVTFLVRIPKGDHFYKLCLYASQTDADPAASIPLIYTYVIEAPSRLMSFEVPYLGIKWGPFPAKLKQ